MKDIPTARREYPTTPPRPTPQQYAGRRGLLIVLLFVAGLGLGGAAIFFTQQKPLSANAGPPIDEPVTAPAPASTVENTGLLSHHPYPEAPQSELMPVNHSGEKVVYLRKSAARQFLLMQTSARRDGINIIPISGFRDIAYQTNLFNRNVARLGGVQQARKVSAPPGYSEHHTGYALDLGDGNAPQTAIEPSFEKTRAFRWLKNNAVRYGFEISFDRGNPQEVNYEPWHWRYIGNKEALETFYSNDAAPSSPSP